MNSHLPATVLLAEDNPDDVLLLQRALRKCRVPVSLQLVQDGEQVLLYLEGLPPYADRERHPLPALLLLDWKLPRRSGHEVLCWVRERSIFDELPVVVLSSSVEEADVRQAYAARANSYLQKPVAADALVARLDAALAYWLLHNIRLSGNRSGLNFPS